MSGMVLAILLTGCIVVPEKDFSNRNRCEISSDKKTLKVLDLAKGTNSYYSISGVILVPLTGIVSGTYVAVNNVYHLGEELIVCK
ncbi:MAG: hypothetical protein EOO52_15715 [Gammaproteobacteria bacterium]|nr:MAG: hypothetical protein EOO52_15715 [Gammaproteobacteria bacterium]